MKQLTTVYHVTSLKNWNKIKSKGLIPKIGKLSDKYGENEKAIYTFISLEELDNALMNWLGQEYEDMEEELEKKIDIAVIEVDIRHLNLNTQTDENGNDFYEQKITEPIPPEYLKLIRIEESSFEED